MQIGNKRFKVFPDRCRDSQKWTLRGNEFERVVAITSVRWCNVRRLPASLPSACDVIGSLYVLQFLIHSTFCACDKELLSFIVVCIFCFRQAMFTHQSTWWGPGKQSRLMLTRRCHWTHVVTTHRCVFITRRRFSAFRTYITLLLSIHSSYFCLSFSLSSFIIYLILLHLVAFYFCFSVYFHSR